jgi:hypothetical protein
MSKARDEIVSCIQTLSLCMDAIEADATDVFRLSIMIEVAKLKAERALIKLELEQAPPFDSHTAL